MTISPSITAAGKDLFMRSIGGEKITFTKFKIGNGDTSEIDLSNMSDIVNPLLEIPISAIEKDENYVKITGVFDNGMIQSDFTWKELGLFCKGEDDIEILYTYANDSDSPGILKSGMSDIAIEHCISVLVAVGEAENVTAILGKSAVYALNEDLEDHTKDTNNPHKVTAEDVRLGNVPNVSTNDQTPTFTLHNTRENLISGEKLGVAFGKIARIVFDFIEHLNASNPHKLKCSDIEAAPVKHEHSAADINKGTLGVARGGTGCTTEAELNEKIQKATQELIAGQKSYIASDTIICVLMKDTGTYIVGNSKNYIWIGSITPKISGTVRVFYKMDDETSLYYSVNDGEKIRFGESEDFSVEESVDINVNANNEYSFYVYSYSTHPRIKTLKIGAMIVDTAQFEYTPYGG